MNSAAVSAIMRCSSVKSSGVKTSVGRAVLDQEAAAAGGDDGGLGLGRHRSPTSLLEDPGGAHAAAHAHGDQAVAAPCGAAARPGSARSAWRPCSRAGWPSAIAPPFTFTFSGSRPSGLDHGQGLGGEGLVQLDEVDVGEREAGLLQRLRDRLDGADAHDLRRHARHRVGDEAGQRRRGPAPSRARPTSRPWPPRRRTSGEALPAVTDPSAANAGRSLASAGGVGVAARAFVGVEATVGRAVTGRHGSGTISSLKRPPSMAATACWCERRANASGLLAVDAVLLRHQLRGHAHAEVAVGVALEQRRVGRDLVAAHGDEAHGLGAARRPPPARGRRRRRRGRARWPAGPRSRSG